MVNDDGDDVIQLLVDTGVLTSGDAAQIHTVQTEVVVHHMRERDVLLPHEEEEAREILTILTGGGPLPQRIQAKLNLVRIITKNIHRRIDQQNVRTRKQKERITGGAFPMVARLAKKT